MSDDLLIYVDNNIGSDANPGTPSSPLATADEAFRRLPSYWLGRAEIIFAATRRDYPIRTDAVYFGTPIGPDASPLVIRGAYEDLFVVRATNNTTGDNIVTTVETPEDQLIGAVLLRLTGAGSPAGTAISIRGNSHGVNSSIVLQRTIGPIFAGDTFKVQRPAVTLAPVGTLSLTSHDGRSPNFTLLGIKIEPAPGAGLNFLNLRAQCDTCEFSFKTASSFVHTSARIQGGIENENLSPGLGCGRAQAGVYIHSTDSSDIFSAVRDGVLSGHLTFSTITVRVSQGGVFVPQSLEALGAPIQILAGGAAMGQPSWGTANNSARIRAVAGASGDGLRLFNGASLNSPLAALNLDIFGCGRDGIRLEAGSSAAFGPSTRFDPATRTESGGETGLFTSGAPNRGLGLNVRTGSRALIGTDETLTGTRGDVGLDDVAVGSAARGAGWIAARTTPRTNPRMSFVCLHSGSPA